MTKMLSNLSGVAPAEADPVAVILLIRWVEHNMPGPNGEKQTLDRIANAFGVSRHVLNRFLRQKLSPLDEKERTRLFLEPLRAMLGDPRRLPGTVQTLMASVFGEADLFEQDESAPVHSPEVIHHQSMTKVEPDAAKLQPLYGLSVLLRIANETVPPTEAHEKNDVHGWSISVLNVIPPHIQKGRHHPLFKLRQRGKNNVATTIEGVVITRDDRLIFQGVDTRRRLPFSATMAMPDAGMHKYRDANTQTMCTGVMTGLRSAGEPFSTLFELLAVPGSEPTAPTKFEEAEAFRRRYRDALDKTGVRNLRETVNALSNIGFRDQKWLATKLRDMRDRCPQPLRPF